MMVTPYVALPAGQNWCLHLYESKNRMITDADKVPMEFQSEWMGHFHHGIDNGLKALCLFWRGQRPTPQQVADAVARLGVRSQR